MWKYLFLAILLSFSRMAAGQQNSSDEVFDEMEAMFEEYENRKIYQSLTVEILSSIKSDDMAVEAIIDYVRTKSTDGIVTPAILNTVSEPIRSVYAVWMLDAQVTNGGFNQYYWNGGYEFVQYAIAGLRYFGLSQHEEITKSSVIIYSNEFPVLNKLKLGGTWKDFSNSYEASNLGNLADEYFELSDQFYETIFLKIRMSPSEFIGN